MSRNDTYDPMGNLATVTLNGNAVSSYTYDDTGNRTRVDFGNGTWQTFSYGNDARYLSTGIDYAYKCDSNDTVTNKGGLRLTRSNGGNPLSWADNTDKFIKTFSYDTQGRLANADIPGVSRTDYGYDWVGNRTSPTAVYNVADQLTSYNGNSYTYWDDNGGMNTGAGRTFGYYSNGDPYQVSLNGTSKNGRFESHGLREVTYGLATTKYSYDITASTPAMISEGPNEGTTTYFYVREPNGELIMRKSGTDYKYYHFDELGSTLFLTDANGIQTDKYVYNAWGKVVSSSGSTVNPYRYIGRYGYYYDTETNLYLLGKRYYDADAGVFCQRDAAKDGLSYYAYTSGKVMRAIDPWGRIGCVKIGDNCYGWNCHGRSDCPPKKPCNKSEKDAHRANVENTVTGVISTIVSNKVPYGGDLLGWLYTLYQGASPEKQQAVLDDCSQLIDEASNPDEAGNDAAYASPNCAQCAKALAAYFGINITPTAGLSLCNGAVCIGKIK